jgi:hypothetical protein
MTLTRRLLEQKVNDYEEPQYDEELDRLDSLPDKFESGDWTQDDLKWIITWKVGRAFEKPTLRHFLSNPDERISDAIETAVTARAVGDKVDALTSIKGVGVPVASAILLFIDPERFTVIDERAWGALREMEYIDRELSEDPTIEEYVLYLGVCRSLANEYDVDLRMLDRALWALGGDE